MKIAVVNGSPRRGGDTDLPVDVLSEGICMKTRFIGFDSSDRMIAALREGKLDGFVVQDPMQIGYLGVRTLVRHLRGEQVERRIDTGSILVTGENIDEATIKSLLDSDLDKWLK